MHIINHERETKVRSVVFETLAKYKSFFKFKLT